MATMEPDWLGKGFRWPLTIDGAGGLAITSGVNLVEQSMRIIIGTAPGDYVLWPDFGCRAHERVFDPASPDTAGLLAADVRDALMRWEPRIEVIDVRAAAAGADRSRIEVTITYRIRGTRDARVLTYPFYLETGGGTNG